MKPRASMVFALLCIVIPASIATAGRRPTIEYQLLESSPPRSLSLHRVAIASPDSSLRGSGWELEFPDDMSDASLDPRRERLLVAYSDPSLKSRKAQIVACVDLRDGTIRWSARCNAPTIQLFPNHILVHSGDSLLFVHAESGQPRWGRAPIRASWGLVGTQQGDRLLAAVEPIPRAGGPNRAGTDRFYPGAKDESRVEPTHTILALDVETGHVVWDKDVTYEGPLDWRVLDSRRMYYAGDGLGALDLTDGASWYLPAATRASKGGLASALAIATLVGLSAMGAPDVGLEGAAGVAGMYDPSVTHHLGSRPLVDGDDVYFVARKELIRARGTDGQVVWKAALAHEPGFTQLFDLGSRILVLGSGWKFVGSRIAPASRATAALVEKKSGVMVAVATQEPSIERVVLRNARREKDVEPHTLLDATGWPGGVLLLGPREISVRDSALAPVAEVRSETYGSFLHFVEGLPWPPLVRTTKGVFALADDGRTVRWWRELKPATNLHKNKPLSLEGAFEEGLPFFSLQGPLVEPKKSWPEMAWVSRADAAYSTSLVTGTYYATPSEGGFVCLDARTGLEVSKYQTPSALVVGRLADEFLSLSSPRRLVVIRLAAKTG